MAFPTGWGRRCELKIQNGKVPANLTNFPVLFTVDNLPSEMFDADGSYPALNGGGDIRFSSDQTGSSRLACEVVRFVIDNNPALGIAEIWVNVPSVSSSSDTSIWVWYNKTGESQPARDAAYGMEATWNSDFVGVWHFNEASGAAKDSTSYNTDGTVSGGITREQPGQVGYSYYSDESNGEVNAGDPVDGHLDFGTEGFTVAFWLNSDAVTGSWAVIINKNISNSTIGYRVELRPTVMTLVFQICDGSSFVSTSPELDVGQDVWEYWVAQCDRVADELHLFKDGVDSASISISAIGGISSSEDLHLLRAANPLLGWMDDVQFSKIKRPNGWITASHNSQDDPATFVLEQTPQSPVAYKLEGITYDKDGSVLGSCECYLFKDNLDDTVTYVGYTLSNAVTGAYSFTGIGDADAQYIVVAWKDDSPHVFDVTDHVLQPVAE